MNNKVAYRVGDPKVRLFRVVRCMNWGLLADGTERKLGVYIGSKAEFGVFVDGQLCPSEEFNVS
jgi:hypothetical protein